MTMKGSFFILTKDKTWIKISSSATIGVEFTPKEEFVLSVRCSINIDNEILYKYKSIARSEFSFILKNQINIRYISLLESGIKIDNAEKEIEYPSLIWEPLPSEFEMIVEI